MKDEIEIITASNDHRPQIISLLKEEKLPFEDIFSGPDHFFVAVIDTIVIAAIGLEQYDQFGLLRSLVVKDTYRNRRIANKLINELIMKAKNIGIQRLYLLTETAMDYFKRNGFEIIKRSEVPEALLNASEFKFACPKSAIVMTKQTEINL
jgi:amino-acid N-acetyltransferase